MRTTVTIDPDVQQLLQDAMQRSRQMGKMMVFEHHLAHLSQRVRAVTQHVPFRTLDVHFQEVDGLGEMIAQAHGGHFVLGPAVGHGISGMLGLLDECGFVS